jgi:hypothetical protein
VAILINLTIFATAHLGDGGIGEKIDALQCNLVNLSRFGELSAGHMDAPQYQPRRG